ncbi:MAG: hypothetical protein WCY11_11470 [Novosphingobium sp.]
MRFMMSGAAAALALMAGSVHAQPAHSQGKGGNENAADKNAGKGNARPDNARSDNARQETRGNAGAKPDKSDRGPSANASRGSDARANVNDNGRNERAQMRVPVEAGNRNDNAGAGRKDAPGQAVAQRKGPGEAKGRGSDLNRDRGLINGCPPGLAKKHNGCMPPGLARQTTYRWTSPSWFGSRWGGDYRYFDGYMVRMGAGDLITGFIPLLGGALSVGQIWPGSYVPVELPTYYSDYYGLGAPDTWRYYDNTFYRVDPETSAITSIAALLTGDDIVIGQPMPLGYDIYNVPAGWRDQYYDSPDAYYRYSDGYIYQLDPTTRLVQAAIELLV